MHEHHVMKAHKGNGDKTPHILDLGI